MKLITSIAILLLSIAACKKNDIEKIVPEPVETTAGKIKTIQTEDNFYTYPSRQTYDYNEKGKLKKTTNYLTNNGVDYDSAGSFNFIYNGKEVIYFPTSGSTVKSIYTLNDDWLVYKGGTENALGPQTATYSYNSYKQLVEINEQIPRSSGEITSVQYKWYYTNDKCDSFTHNSSYPGRTEQMDYRL